MGLQSNVFSPQKPGVKSTGGHRRLLKPGGSGPWRWNPGPQSTSRLWQVMFATMSLRHGLSRIHRVFRVRKEASLEPANTEEGEDSDSESCQGIE